MGHVTLSLKESPGLPRLPLHQRIDSTTWMEIGRTFKKSDAIIHDVFTATLTSHLGCDIAGVFGKLRDESETLFDRNSVGPSVPLADYALSSPPKLHT